MDDLEAPAVEALDLLEITRKPAGNRDVRVREACDRAVAEREAAVLAELVEAVLRRDTHRNARQRAGELAVDVGMHEVRVQDPRARARQVAGDAKERDRIDVGRERDSVERDATRAQLAREVPRAGLVLVQHQEANVPAASLQLRQQREQVCLRARDPGHLLQVQDGHDDDAAARIPSAQVSTEWLRATRSRSVRPISERSAPSRAASQRSRPARLDGDPRSKKSG